MKIVTISRECGAGGREIGLAAAKELGVELYDRDIIRSVARQSGLDYDYLSEEAEQISKTETFLRNITPMQYDQKDSLFDMQKEIVLNFAKQGPCVILGRCADSILDEAGYDTFNVFLYGDEVVRAVEAGKELGINDAGEIQKHMKKVDAERKAHYERYSGRHWADYRNYDLMLNSGALGFELCTKMIVEAVKSMEK